MLPSGMHVPSTGKAVRGEKPAVPRTTNETHGFVGLSAILALSLAVLGTRCFSPHRKGRYNYLLLVVVQPPCCRGVKVGGPTGDPARLVSVHSTDPIGWLRVDSAEVGPEVGPSPP